MKTAIQNKDIKALETAVTKAVDAYKVIGAKAVADEKEFTTVAKPTTPMVETAFGEVPFDMIFDEDTKWNIITQAYVEVAGQVGNLPTTATAEEVKEVTTRLITGNAVLRAVGGKGQVTNDFL